MLDIAGWPKRRFYEMLKLSATDEQEKEHLEGRTSVICAGSSRKSLACKGELFKPDLEIYG